MAVSLSPSVLGTDIPLTPKVYSADELARLKKEPTKLAIEGNVYQSRNIHNKKLSLDELMKETITVDTSTLERVTNSDGSRAPLNRLVALRDSNGEVVTLQLSQKTISRLQAKFGDSDNFFERPDGVLRLNGEAEDFVTSWLEDIRKARNYEKADADGNGKIEGDERKELKIGFERNGNYDYLGEKLVDVNLGVGDTYQKLGDTPDASHLFYTDEEQKKYEQQGYEHKRTALSLQYDQFSTSVEKELEHTLQMDDNLDGTVTFEEKMIDEYGSEGYRTTILTELQEKHDRMLEDHPDLNDESRVQNQELFTPEILNEEEKKALMESFHRQAEAIAEKTDQIFQNPFFLNGYEVQLLGQTESPDSYPVPGEQPSMLDIRA